MCLMSSTMTWPKLLRTIHIALDEQGVLEKQELLSLSLLKMMLQRSMTSSRLCCFNQLWASNIIPLPPCCSCCWRVQWARVLVNYLITLMPSTNQELSWPRNAKKRLFLLANFNHAWLCNVKQYYCSYQMKPSLFCVFMFGGPPAYAGSSIPTESIAL